jgi:glycerophosphoryl diester phosphodiesterase
LDGLIRRLGEILEETGAADQAVFISFDHPVLLALRKRFPGIRTEGITHARHADIVAVARAADLDSVSIELNMFRPEDGEALHRAGVAVRVHLDRPASYARFAALGLDLLADLRTWLANGTIDTLSGDDVAFLASVVAESAPADTVAA